MLDDVVSGMGYYKNIFFFFFSLATVQSFRAEVLRKASSNVFEQLSKQDKQIVYSKKTEYPQHIPRKRRSRANRHKTNSASMLKLSDLAES
jgi:hypothetical protein